MRSLKGRSRRRFDIEKPVPPAPESVRQEGGREVKVYPKRYADGYQAQQNVRPKGTIR
jgi:hypothetical protein